MTAVAAEAPAPFDHDAEHAKVIARIHAAAEELETEMRGSDWSGSPLLAYRDAAIFARQIEAGDTRLAVLAHRALKKAMLDEITESGCLMPGTFDLLNGLYLHFDSEHWDVRGDEYGPRYTPEGTRKRRVRASRAAKGA